MSPEEELGYLKAHAVELERLIRIAPPSAVIGKYQYEQRLENVKSNIAIFPMYLNYRQYVFALQAAGGTKFSPHLEEFVEWWSELPDEEKQQHLARFEMGYERANDLGRDERVKLIREFIRQLSA